MLRLAVTYKSSPICYTVIVIVIIMMIIIIIVQLMVFIVDGKKWFESGEKLVLLGSQRSSSSLRFKSFE